MIITFVIEMATFVACQDTPTKPISAKILFVLLHVFRVKVIVPNQIVAHVRLAGWVLIAQNVFVCQVIVIKIFPIIP